MKLPCILAFAFSALVPLSPALAAPNDDVIVQAREAFRKDDERSLARLKPLARGHALEQWVDYWELRARLGSASAAEVEAFLTRWPGTYVEDRLRNDWLLELGRRRDFAAFAREYPRFRMHDDREVRCYALAIEAREGKDVSREVLANWYSLREADDGCTFAARTLFEAGRVKPADIWREARISVEGNRARGARNALAILGEDAIAGLTEAIERPSAYLARGVRSGPAGRELATLALVRLASSVPNNDPDAAATWLERNGAELTPEQRGYAWGMVAKYNAMRLSSDAPEQTDKARLGNDAQHTDDTLGWMTRAALRAGRWQQALQSINAMSPEGQADATWAYWKARALRQLAATSQEPAALRSEAEAILARLATGPSLWGFYGQLAAEDLGRPLSLPPRPVPLTAAEREAARGNAGLQRALKLIELGGSLRLDGVREWNWTVNFARPPQPEAAAQGRLAWGQLPDRELLAAAALACEREVYDRCINTSDRTREEVDVEQRFPTPHREAVMKRSREIGLDPAYVYGLIRQESRFIMDARSHVGASGLMQLMPATARWTARRIGLDGFTPDMVNDRDVNIALGTGYLKIVLDDFGGNQSLAAAAYNAGPGRSRRWREGPVLDAAIWAENVPFTETRDYVKKVTSNATWYAALLSGRPQSLRARIGTVGPRDASAPAPNREIP
jgi:soluble lytic murein transglycosylase